VDRRTRSILPLTTFTLWSCRKRAIAWRRAVRCIGRSTFSPDFAVAHFALGNLARADSRSSAANKHFANALHVLRGCPPDELPPPI